MRHAELVIGACLFTALSAVFSQSKDLFGLSVGFGICAMWMILQVVVYRGVEYLDAMMQQRERCRLTVEAAERRALERELGK